MCSIKVDRVTLAVSVAACVGRGTYGLYFGSKSKVTVGLDVVYLGLLNYEQLCVVCNSAGLPGCVNNCFGFCPARARVYIYIYANYHLDVGTVETCDPVHFFLFLCRDSRVGWIRRIEWRVFKLQSSDRQERLQDAICAGMPRVQDEHPRHHHTLHTDTGLICPPI